MYPSPQVFFFFIEKNPTDKLHKEILLTKMSLIIMEVGIFSLKDQVNNWYYKLSGPNGFCIFLVQEHLWWLHKPMKEAVVLVLLFVFGTKLNLKGWDMVSCLKFHWIMFIFDWFHTRGQAIMAVKRYSLRTEAVGNEKWFSVEVGKAPKANFVLVAYFEVPL